MTECFRMYQQQRCFGDNEEGQEEMAIESEEAKKHHLIGQKSTSALKARFPEDQMLFGDPQEYCHDPDDPGHW